MRAKEIANIKIKEVEELLCKRAKEEGIELEKNTYFKDTTYLSLRNKNDPNVRVYIEAGHFHLFDGLKIVSYHNNYQTSYGHSLHEVEDIVKHALHNFKNPETKPVSGSAKPNNNVEEHFSKWEEVN